MRRLLPWAVLALSLGPALAPLLAPPSPAPLPAADVRSLEPTMLFAAEQLVLHDVAYAVDDAYAAGGPAAGVSAASVAITGNVVVLDASAGLGPAAASSARDADTVALLMAASQQLLGAMALAPHAAAHAPALADLRAPTDAPHAQATLQALATDIAAMPGWLKQAMWAVTLTALGGLALRAAAPLAMTLFTRLDADAALRQERRALLHGLIHVEPGLSLAELRRQTGLSHGAAQHHLRMLEAHGLVRSHAVGRQRRYFPAGPRASPAALVPDGARRVLELLGGGGLTTAEVARRAGRTPQTVWSQLRTLQRHGLVDVCRRGRAVAWSARPA